MMVRSWTEEEDEKLRKLLSEGLSSSQIGARLGRSRNAVIGRRHRLGIKDDIRLIRQRDGARTQMAKRAKKLGIPDALPPRRKDQNEAVGQANKTPFTLKYFHIGKGAKPIIQEPFIMPPEQTTAQVDSVIDLEAHHCRWPLPRANGDGHGFCGCTAVWGHSYCVEHFARSRGLTCEQVGVYVTKIEQKRLAVKEAAE